MNVLINMQHAHAPCLAQFISAAQQIQTVQIRAVCVIACDAGRIPITTQSITVCLRKVEKQMKIKNHENNSSKYEKSTAIFAVHLSFPLPKLDLQLQ